MMMFWTTLFAIGSLWFCYVRARSLYRFIAEAKATGLPYVILPFNLFSIPWAIAQPILIPLLELLPAKFTERRLPLLLFARGWFDGYEPFRRMGCDTFVAVSSTGNICYTCDRQFVQQMLRSSLVDKPADLMGVLNVFGPTMTGTRNQESKTYRKVTTPFFNESNMQEIWMESTQSAQVALKVLTGEHRSNPARGLRPILMRLSLHILNAVCFGSREDLMAELTDSGHPPSGHQLTYSQAMHNLIDYLPTIFLVGPSLLKISPFKAHKEARQSYLELRKYMEELRDNTTLNMESNSSEEGNSILDLIVQAGLPRSKQRRPTLTPAEVLGNMFIFMFAGHEASANTMTFLIILLACHPCIQRRLQHDIDRIIGSATSSSQSWSYEAVYPLLSESMLAAVINETLRLFTLLPFIPKKITKESFHAFKITDRTYNLPPGMLILLNTSALHRNPKLWPQPKGQGQAGTNHNPVADFDPDAWFYTDFGDTKSQEGTRRLRHPQEGSYVPFSDGHRGCLGKKFALVELYGVVARIFSEYTVELALDGILEQQNDDSQEANRWKEARKRAEHQLSAGIEFKMSLRPVGTVPLNFVKRGNESFAGI